MSLSLVAGHFSGGSPIHTSTEWVNYLSINTDGMLGPLRIHECDHWWAFSVQLLEWQFSGQGSRHSFLHLEFSGNNIVHNVYQTLFSLSAGHASVSVPRGAIHKGNFPAFCWGQSLQGAERQTGLRNPGCSDEQTVYLCDCCCTEGKCYAVIHNQNLNT